jgi:hypothetical protein
VCTGVGKRALTYSRDGGDVVIADIHDGTAACALACDRRSDIRNGGQKGFLPAPFKRPVYRCTDRVFDRMLLVLLHLYDAPDDVSNALWSLAGSLPLHAISPTI